MAGCSRLLSQTNALALGGALRARILGIYFRTRSFSQRKTSSLGRLPLTKAWTSFHTHGSPPQNLITTPSIISRSSQCIPIAAGPASTVPSRLPPTVPQARLSCRVIQRRPMEVALQLTLLTLLKAPVVLRRTPQISPSVSCRPPSAPQRRLGCKLLGNVPEGIVLRQLIEARRLPDQGAGRCRRGRQPPWLQMVTDPPFLLPWPCLSRSPISPAQCQIAFDFRLQRGRAAAAAPRLDPCERAALVLFASQMLLPLLLLLLLLHTAPPAALSQDRL